MSFFNRKKQAPEGLPELPELPELSPLPYLSETSQNVKLPPLPSFPKIPNTENNENMLLKNTINEPLEKPFTREIEDFEELTAEKSAEFIKTSQIKIEPIFVRIDKYQESLANFQEVKKKLLEIENSLRDIREIKAREESELQGWEHEIQEAKIKIDKIDKNIFKKLDE